VLPSKVAQV
jgi:hypothetical protein